MPRDGIPVQKDTDILLKRPGSCAVWMNSQVSNVVGSWNDMWTLVCVHWKSCRREPESSELLKCRRRNNHEFYHGMGSRPWRGKWGWSPSHQVGPPVMGLWEEHLLRKEVGLGKIVGLELTEFHGQKPWSETDAFSNEQVKRDSPPEDWDFFLGGGEWTLVCVSRKTISDRSVIPDWWKLAFKMCKSKSMSGLEGGMCKAWHLECGDAGKGNPMPGQTELASVWMENFKVRECRKQFI